MKEGEQYQFNQYQYLLQQYNNQVTEYAEKQEEGWEDDEEREESCASLKTQFRQCDQQYNKLVERRELNENTFRTICDNYCVSLVYSPYSFVENPL